MVESKKDSIKEGNVVNENQKANELDGITALLQGVVTPFAHSQEVTEKETTKRTEILAKIANRGMVLLFLVALLIIVLSAYALSLGNENMAEKLVIALLAFLGGLGAGKASNK